MRILIIIGNQVGDSTYSREGLPRVSILSPLKFHMIKESDGPSLNIWRQNQGR